MGIYDDRPDIYYLSNYGNCSRGHCLCTDGDNPRYGGAWAGIVCPDWVPLGAKDMEQLIQAAKETYLNAKDKEKAAKNNTN